MAPGLRIIAWAARIVPPDRRERWRREWEAEVSYAWRRLAERGRPSRLAVLRLRLRALTSLIDALWVKKETMTMIGLLNDVRHALRSLARYPTFTAIAVATLALGIGANTAVFTLVDGVMLSPLPYEESEKLLALEHLGRDGRDELPMSLGLYQMYREQADALEEIALYAPASVNLVSEGEPERIDVQYVTPSFFDVLRVGAAIGRTFMEEEGAPGGENVVLLADALWRTRFGADRAVVGRTLDIDGTSRRIVGVMPEGFGHPDRQARLWLPLQVDPTNAPLASFGTGGVGRLAEGAGLEDVQTELTGLISRLGELFPDSGAPAFLAEVGLRPLVRPLKEAVVGEVDTTLWVLLGTVGLVLLIACANVANLLLLRAESRQRELALRVAIGAGRGQVLRTFLSESSMLAAAGGALGVCIAIFAVRASLAAVPTNLPRVDEVGLDVRVLAFTLGLTALCALFFGLFPMLHLRADDLGSQLRDGAARGATGGRERNRLRSGLVIGQMAVALVLLIASGLMLRSFRALQAIDPGFRAEGVLTARITVPAAEISGWEETAWFFRVLRERLAAQPGVEAVGMAQAIPLASGVSYFDVELEDHPRGPTELPILARQNRVEAGYFEAMGIELLEGRAFQAGDGAEGTRSVVVSQRFADLWWPDRSPIGRRIRQGDWYQIVGVVADAHYLSLEDDPVEMIYWPATIGPAGSPQPTRTMSVVVRTAGDPLSFVSVLRREVQELNGRIPVSNARTMEGIVSDAMSRNSFTMALLGAASAVALLLGLVGIYGVVSYIVSQRTREIGVRMALGADAHSVRKMVVRQGLRLAVAGVGIGLVAALAFSQVIARLLYGVSTTDPLTYTSVSALLVLVSLTASWIPAARAAGVDPSSTLRSDQ